MYRLIYLVILFFIIISCQRDHFKDKEKAGMMMQKIAQFAETEIKNGSV
jgi:hypothetical protein